MIEQTMTEDYQLWGFFHAQACRQEELQIYIAQLMKQHNQQNCQLNQISKNCEKLWFTINRANICIHELQNTHLKAQEDCKFTESQYQKERQAHELIKTYLTQETARHAKTEAMLRYYEQMVRMLSEFLSMLKVTFKKDKAVIVKELNDTVCLESLMLKLKQKHKQAKEQKVWNQISSGLKKGASDVIHTQEAIELGGDEVFKSIKIEPVSASHLCHRQKQGALKKIKQDSVFKIWIQNHNLKELCLE